MTATAEDETTTTEDVAKDAHQLVKSEAPWVEWVTRAGWASRGLVHLLMGVIALNIVFGSSGESASPKGALTQVMEQPGGRIMLFVLAVGLVLFAAWRLLTVALIAGSEPIHWLRRIVYTLSALFFVALSWIALNAVLRDERPEDGNAIERVTRTLMETVWTRVLLGLAGVAVLAVGVSFIVHGVIRSFTDELDDVDETLGSNGAFGRVLLVGGVIGWSGRGVETALIGFFVTRSALRFDPSDARGLDRALHQAATSGVGSVLVACAAAGLIAYGLYCLLSIPRRCLEIER